MVKVPRISRIQFNRKVASAYNKWREFPFMGLFIFTCMDQQVCLVQEKLKKKSCQQKWAGKVFKKVPGTILGRNKK